METHKAAEAESILSALRSEQEYRCVQGKNYQTDLSAVEAVASAKDSKNYTYSLTATGAKAVSAKGYSIEMPFYKNGQLCCHGTYCDSLNKAYPKCEDLPDIVDDECASAEGPVPDPDPEPETPVCTAGEWKNNSVPHEIYAGSVLNSDCANKYSLGGDAASELTDFSNLPGSCTDVVKLSDSWMANELGSSSSTVDTCDGNNIDAYTCTSAKDSCIDVKTQADFRMSVKVNYACPSNSGYSKDIDWNSSGITMNDYASCNVNGFTQSIAEQKCRASKKQGNICYQTPQIGGNCGGTSVFMLNGRWYVSGEIGIISCGSVAKKISCRKMTSYKYRQITCS